MSNVVNSFWAGLSRGMRAVAIGSAAVCLALLIWGLFIAFHEEYRVLFSDLAQGDAAAIVERLKKDKVAYRLSSGGATVSVPAEQVHEVRLGLMAGDLPLNGGVGFEIFDKQGLGTTEQSQKVSFQRALQGELSRTIGSLENVKQVRVHLVMPQSTLFSKDRQEASAAVNVGMQPGTSLQRQQIVGVQRLVAAAVPGLVPAQVVITDQRGITLSSADEAGVGSGAAEARLQVKTQVEEYITRKITRLLDSAFGPGQAIVSVDAALNFDATKTTIQDLLPADGSSKAEGRVVRRRQVTGSSTAEPLWTSAAEGDQPGRTPSSSMEIEYEYGRRIDEIIAAPGGLTRISVGVVVPADVTEEKRRKITELVRMAAGISEVRGDAVSVQTLLEVSDAPADDAAPETPMDVETADSVPRVSLQSFPVGVSQWIVVGGVAAGALLIVVLITLSSRTRSRRSLSTDERQRLLDEIQRALTEQGIAATGRSRS